MSGASVYPQSLDADANLTRRVASDALLISDHNNLVDALESVEPTIGVVDNTLGGAITPNFNTGLAHYAGFPSTAIRNPRFPFGSPAATDLYAYKGALPTGAVVAAGMVADFLSDAGFLRLKFTAVAGWQLLTLPLAGGAPVCFIARLKFSTTNGGDTVGFGVLQTGQVLPTVLGVNTGGGWYTYVNGGGAAHQVVNGGQSIMGGWGYVQCYWDGTHYQFAYSDDGVTWSWVTQEGTLAPIAVCVAVSLTQAPQSLVWVDFIQQGTVQIGA